MTEWLTTEEVAEKLKVPPASVKRWRAARTGPPYIQVGRHVRYPVDAFERWARAKSAVA
jgi:excisionase family DNA binding protein